MQESSITFTIPDFTNADGTEFTEIVVVVEMNSDIADTVKLVDALQHPIGSANE
jgi:hypothetical protein